MSPTNSLRRADGAVPTRMVAPIRGLRWWIALVLMGVTVVNYLDRTCLAVAAPVLKKDLAMDEVDFSHILVAFQLSYFLMQPIAGRIIDWLQLRRGLAISIVWWSIAQMLTAFASGWLGFAALRALLGFGEAANFPSAAKAVSQWFPPKERTIATGILNVGAGIGGLIAPPLVAYLILRFNWQMAFVVTGAVGLVWVVFWLAVYRSPDEHPRMSAAELEYIRSESAAAPPPVTNITKDAVFRSVIRSRSFWGLAIARFLSEPAWQFFTYWIPLYLATERHLNLREIAYFAWAPFLAGDVGCIVGGFLSPFFMRFGVSVMTSRKLAVTFAAVLMVSAAFIGRAPTAGWAVFFFCIAAFAHQAISSTLLTLPADLFPQHAVATANGASGLFGGLGGMAFTMAVGIVAVTIGYAPLFVLMGTFDLLGAAFLWILLRNQAST